MCVKVGLEEVKKLGINLNSLYHEKDRQKKVSNNSTMQHIMVALQDWPSFQARNRIHS